MILRLISLLLAVALIGCSGAPAPQPLTPESEPELAIRWVRDAAEYRAAVLQAYDLATHRVESLAPSRERGSWAVVLDADETVISNLDYSIRRIGAEPSWSEESWNVWVREETAPALPGAVEFIERVRALGGRVAIVTNRSDSVCEETGNNLRAVGAIYDVLRCRVAESSKQARWDAVASGEGTGLGPLEILLWMGDNIHDFPGLEQSSANDAMNEIGERFVVLPNPLYGSWEE